MRKKIYVELNKNEYELYKIIKNYIEKNKYSPSYRELVNLSNYKSLSSIMLTLLKFEELGFVELGRDKNDRIKSRTIRLIYTSEVREKIEKLEEIYENSR